MTRRIVFLFSLTAFRLTTFAQWECPSQLGGSLKPVGQSSLMWAGELTGAAGALYHNTISNEMGFLALDFSTSHHTFYGEGGFKYWQRTDNQLNTTFSNSHWGIRELLYSYKHDGGKITSGIQSVSSPDGFLVNERMAGLNIVQNFSEWRFTFSGGTVTRDFARNGVFCSKGYLYDIIPHDERALIGIKPGDTNLAYVSADHKVGGNKTSDDEFASSDDSPRFYVDSYGGLFYTEFGDWIENSSVLLALYSKIEWKGVLTFSPEVIYQSGIDNRAFIYRLEFQRDIESAKGNVTTFMVRYFGLNAIDEGAQASVSFSNIMAGEVLRLDAIDFPLLQASVKQRFAKAKCHIKLQYSQQTQVDKMSEIDAEVGNKFWQKLSVNLQYGHIVSNDITTSQLRTELRYTF